jgi:hypothetical protein
MVVFPDLLETWDALSLCLNEVFMIPKLLFGLIEFGNAVKTSGSDGLEGIT